MKRRDEIIAEYYAAAHDGLTDYACRLIGNSMEAEDIVHDAFLKLLSGNTMIAVATLPSLMHTMVRNRVADRFRRQAYARAHAVEAVRCSVDGGDASSLCSRHEVETWLEHGMALLPERCRDVYRLHIVDGMKIAEIQKITGRNYKQLEHTLGMARRQMRQYMKRFAS